MSNGLDVVLMKNPFGEWSPENGDRYTDIAFSGSEWGSFMFGTLKVPEAGRIEGETFEEFCKRRDSLFRSSLKDFPLLARISDFYWDSSFELAEVPLLKAELERSSVLTLDEEAKAFLDGMLEACAAAESANLGISLASS